MTPEQIVAYLEEHGRSTVKMIGTDNATMYALEKAGAVQKDGIIRIDGAGRGRPPTAWIVANGEVAATVKAPSTKGSPEHVKAMHKGKEKKRLEREKEDKKAKQTELKELKAQDLWPAYSKALAEALNKNTKSTWHKADNLQNQLISQSNRVKHLESELA